MKEVKRVHSDHLRLHRELTEVKEQLGSDTKAGLRELANALLATGN